MTREQELEAALKQAIIRGWRSVQEGDIHSWTVYWANYPAMRPIRAALGGVDPTEAA